MPPDSAALELMLMDAKGTLFVQNYSMQQFKFSRMIIPQRAIFSFSDYCSTLSHFKIYVVRLVSDEK
jgi:hypothetical protein